MDENTNWKMKTFAIGGAIGLLIGLGAAYILVKRAETEGDRPQLTTGEGVRLGLGILGLLRLISSPQPEK